jgi:hypothetical protein
MTPSGLVSRIVSEHRRTVYVLVAGFVVNFIVYGFVVYPLQTEVATVEQRTRAAAQARAAARPDAHPATGTMTGKERAIEAHGSFYGSVLVSDLAGARRITYARLAELAGQSRLSYQRGTYDPVVERGSTLTRFKVSMDLTGSYDSIRSFIHEVETAPEFIVIDTVSVTDVGGGAPLRLTMEMSTYFRHTRS